MNKDKMDVDKMDVAEMDVAEMVLGFDLSDCEDCAVSLNKWLESQGVDNAEAR